jgi:hypothetical protein
MSLFLDLSKEAFDAEPTAGVLFTLLRIHVTHHAQELVAAGSLAKLQGLLFALLAEGLDAQLAGALQRSHQLLGQGLAVDVFFAPQAIHVLHAVVFRAPVHLVFHGRQHLLEHGQLAHVAEQVVEGPATKHETEHHFDVDVAGVLGHLHTLLAALVVDLALLRVREHLVRLADPFELELRLCSGFGIRAHSI